MELTKELKEKINNYFANISAEDVIALAIEKYAFKEKE